MIIHLEIKGREENTFNMRQWRSCSHEKNLDHTSDCPYHTLVAWESRNLQDDISRAHAASAVSRDRIFECSALLEAPDFEGRGALAVEELSGVPDVFSPGVLD